MAIYRLNYAIDMRYGVLHELARSIHEDRPIHLAMGHANIIWQGDANEMALRSLLHCSSPPEIINITGPETMSIRWAAQELAARMGKEVTFTGTESETALLNNASKSHQLFGYPKVSLLQMLDWTAAWVQSGGESWNKPTHFQERKGKF
jgi:nucleoside-diphosphate-sugar epimerase